MLALFLAASGATSCGRRLLPSSSMLPLPTQSMFEIRWRACATPTPRASSPTRGTRLAPGPVTGSTRDAVLQRACYRRAYALKFTDFLRRMSAETIKGCAPG